jgi:hypothetical protein
MLLIVELTSEEDHFPVKALKEVEAALVALGFKKEVHSVVKPQRQYSLTYDGPSTQKTKIEESLRSVTAKNNLNFSVEVEESVKFP